MHMIPVSLLEKKLVELIKINLIGNVHIFNEISLFKSRTLIEQISRIIEPLDKYSSITIIYNKPKSFFAQIPTVHTISVDTIMQTTDATHTLDNTDYYWESPACVVQQYLQKIEIQSAIQRIVLESINAENAARFVAMDNSTRNATKLIHAMRLDYNKLRQARITRELTDLAASF